MYLMSLVTTVVGVTRQCEEIWIMVALTFTGLLITYEDYSIRYVWRKDLS